MLISYFQVQAQTENYKKGLSAMKSNRYHEAMIAFTKVVEDEKYEISGKDLSMAYAYLATIRTAYLEKDLNNSNFSSIIQNQGLIKQTVTEMARAVQFKNKNSESLIDPSLIKLEEIAVNALVVIGDSLLAYDAYKPTIESKFLADFAIQQFGELSQIVNDKWELHDVLGLAYFHMGDTQNAMNEFAKGRTQFASLETKPTSQLHLHNYILSGNYFYQEKNNMSEAYKISKQGVTYTSALIHKLSDDQMEEILELNKIENRFRNYMTQIKTGSK